ncbi:UDP-N-acetylglucosamine 1-carboxyvinyltransferase [Streptomyces olivoreticuli]|uniref:UDP-N-acetylglucosamine 1-carboxyvinyltransferase n=1 Tax=Streptomyces olivoreticuli TaxID=68246 RepID=UPI002659E10D|nr:UDP-N-acetylglucosamine 1-carboxyvinyltransferase [Streptomyces olivoreticuli]WKK27508.1 UDP-N-acetylglucosamine 1-carboxyvinyltransferase [Streptomyces olivoreticuli]WKK27596.1 UDP-N-acetylglucosamine 1-carboxyvinyltransferase [Streptomyces olivoreticuli]
MSLSHSALTALPHTLTVRPGRPLQGVVVVDGSKNACLPLLAAAAASGRHVKLSNVPASTDVTLMLGLIQQAGFRLSCPVGESGCLILIPGNAGTALPDLADAARIRASYYLVPALLAAYGTARLPWPGGCQVGARGMGEHLRVYETFGDAVQSEAGHYRVTASTRRLGTVVLGLSFRSRGATIAAVLRAVVAGCRLKLGNPNLSPETTTVLAALQEGGWEVHADEATLTVGPPEASTALSGGLSWAVPGDKIEAGTVACAIAATGGQGRIEGLRGGDVRPLAGLLAQAAIPVTVTGDALTVHGGAQGGGGGLRAVASLAPDGLDADFEPALIALALGLPGTHLFGDSINPGRHSNLLGQLQRLGARIDALSPTQCRLTGPQRLTGALVEATDIRTGSALLIAALSARGLTTLTGLEQLRRGHADLPATLRALGADITEAAR